MLSMLVALLATDATAAHCDGGTVMKEICGNGKDDNCDGFVDNCSIDVAGADYKWVGDTVGGEKLAGPIAIGDLNGNGTPDLAAVSWPGSVYVFDHPSASVTSFTDADQIITDGAWWNGLAVGDANGDGWDDLVTASYYQAYLLDGPVTASTAMSSAADVVYTSAYTHPTVAQIVPDHDGDGSSDVVFGAPYSTGTPYLYELGHVYVVSGTLSGTVDLQSESTYTYSAHIGYDELGLSVCGAGDMTGDGIEELALGAPKNRGKMYVVEGGGYARHVSVTVDALAELEPVARRPGQENFRLGSVAAADYDGDGYGDLFVGASTAPNAHDEATGVAYAFLGPLSGSIHPTDAYTRWDGVAVESMLGGSIAADGDVDGDGSADVLLPAESWYYSSVRGASEVYLQRGATSGVHSVLELESISSGAFDGLGDHVAFVPDWDGDGGDEVAMTAPYSGAGGAVFVLSSDQL